jgi:Retrotransposon gag protein
MADPQLLLQLYQQLQTDIQQLRADNQQLRAEITSLRTEVQSLRSQPPPTRQATLPDPPKFDGKPYKLRTWLPAMRAKIREDGRAGQNAFYYVWDRLEEGQQGLALPLLDTAESKQVWIHEDIFNLLERVHHNPYEQQEARDKLTHIRQGTEEGLSAYIARFERLLYEAGAKDSWPADVKISTFTNGLRSTLKALVQQQLTVPSEYDAYIKLVQQLDRRSRSAAAPRPQPTSHPAPAAPAGDPMQLGAVQINSLDLGCLRAASASPKVRWDRREQGACVRCGSQDHWVHRCPLLPYSRSASPSLRSVSASSLSAPSRSSPQPAIPLPTRKQTARRTNGIPDDSSLGRSDEEDWV